MENQEFQRWVEQSSSRFPTDYITKRLKLETHKAESIFESERGLVGSWANPRTLLKYGLQWSWLSAKGARNALKIQARHNTIPVHNLPQALAGFTILQISDPHFNDHDGFIERLVAVLRQEKYDLCVLTGDYRFRSFGSSEMAMRGLAEVAAVVDTDTLVILGNHDSIKMVPQIESLGMSVLINEHVLIERAGAKLLIAGVDDPRYYRTDDIRLSLKGAPTLDSIASILLAHSPELYTEAADVGFDAYFCGHTHGGQVCFLPGKTLVKNFRSPVWTLAGAWKHKAMVGYTSAGVGTSVVNARFNCAPEITLHELACSKNQNA